MTVNLSITRPFLPVVSPTKLWEFPVFCQKSTFPLKNVPAYAPFPLVPLTQRADVLLYVMAMARRGVAILGRWRLLIAGTGETA